MQTLTIKNHIIYTTNLPFPLILRAAEGSVSKDYHERLNKYHHLFWVSLFLVLFNFSCVINALPQEYIKSIHINMVVNVDASVDVTERITVQTTGQQIKRGIVRSFPTRYTNDIGLQYVVGFDVLAVQRDGIIESYRQEERENGTYLYIGDSHSFLCPGIHTYNIVYRTNRQLGFFDHHDELYWNALGLDSKFWVQQATVRVNLPTGISKDYIQFTAYTGRSGKKGSDFTARVQDDDTVLFETTKPLAPYEGFTIVVGWPKGFVQQPSLLTNIGYHLRDNISIIFLLFGLLFTILFYIWAYRKTREGKKDYLIIPLFYPPHDMYPGGMRYFLRKWYDSKVLTADIIQMAVNGWIKIDYKRGTYALVAQDISEKTLPNYYQRLYDVLFCHSTTCVLSQKNQKDIQRISSVAKKTYSKSEGKNIVYHRSYSFWGFLISALFLASSFLFLSVYAPGLVVWLAGYAIISFMIHGYFLYKLPNYTQAGDKIYEGIEGFKLFLAITETDRLKVIGTPPTKTPELYEKYLPYAVALGVEKQWSQQFAPVFARLAREGQPYAPLWYVGSRPFVISDIHGISSGVNRSINTSIAASKTPPGSNSGFGGGGGRGGSSGGGGGGGGIGGW